MADPILDGEEDFKAAAGMEKLTKIAASKFQGNSEWYNTSRTSFIVLARRLLATIDISFFKRFKRDSNGSSSKTVYSLFHLPQDLIIQLVLARLSIPDYLRCRLVCSSWLAEIDNVIVRKLWHCPSVQLPWLKLSLECQDCFLSLSENHRIYRSNPAYNMNQKLSCVGTVEGWLVMVENALWDPDPTSIPRCFFLNPVSGDRVMLPSQCTIDSDSNHCLNFLNKVVASSSPARSDCVVVALVNRCHWLALCRPGSKSWTLTEFGRHGRRSAFMFRDIEIINGKLFAASWDALEFLMMFDITTFQDADSSNPSSTPKAERLVMLQHGPVPSRFNDHIYLAKDSTSDELFMILRRSSFTEAQGDRTEGFRLFKLECFGNFLQWVKVVDVGSQILCMSEVSNTMIDISGIKGSHGDALKRNCIYFAFDNLCKPGTGCDFGVFSMADCKIKPYQLPPTNWTVGPVWFTPSFN